MPELPEVETVAQTLRRAGFQRRRIRSISIFDRRLLAAGGLRQAGSLQGASLVAVGRHGKYLLLRLSNRKTLVVHLGMSGKIAITQELTQGETRPAMRHERLRVVFSDGWYMSLVDPRRFGKVWLVQTPERLLSQLGPDALSISAEEFDRPLAASKRQIKPLLMDQSVLAGVGNIYADEALWCARAHPTRKACTLKLSDRRRLWRCVRRILRAAIRAGGTSLGEGVANFATPILTRGRYARLLKVYGREGQPCFRCGAAIRRIRVSQRSTYWCPRCQPRPV